MSEQQQQQRHHEDDDIDFDDHDDEDEDGQHIDDEDENLKPLYSNTLQQQHQTLLRLKNNNQEEQHHSGGSDDDDGSRSRISSESSSEEENGDDDDDSSRNSEQQQNNETFLEPVKWGAEDDEEINNRKLWQDLNQTMEEEQVTVDEKGQQQQQQQQPLAAAQDELDLLAAAAAASGVDDEEKEESAAAEDEKEEDHRPLQELALLAAGVDEDDKETDKTRGPLHELALLAAGEEREPQMYTDFNSTPAETLNRGPLHELALLAGEEKEAPYDDAFDDDLSEATVDVTRTPPGPQPQRKKPPDDPLLPSPAAKRQKVDIRTETYEASNTIESDVRKQWNAILEEQSKCQQVLEDAKSELKKAQANLEFARQRNEQVEEAVPKLLSEIYLHLIQDDPPWYDFYQQLQFMKDTNDKSNDISSTNIGRWVSAQRRLYRQNQLDMPKVYALEQVGIDWNPLETKWNQSYARLQEYVQKNGNAKVPYFYEDDGLGAWVKRQQYQYKLYHDQRPSEMTPERIKLLNDVGFVWNRRSKSWMERYEHLQAFKKQNGHINVPVKAYPSLNEWVREQRTQLKKYKVNEGSSNRDANCAPVSTLSKEQVDLLQSIGLETDVRDSRWQSKLDELYEFRNVHGHCHVPKKYPKNQALANWCGTQRRQCKLFQQQQQHQSPSHTPSFLTNDRIAKLLEVGFEFDPSTTQGSRKQLKTTWEEQFSSLKAFSEAKGHLNVPRDSPLGKWWSQQKQNFSTADNNQLTENQISRLKELLLHFEKNDDCPIENVNRRISRQAKIMKTWEEHFEELLAHRIYANSFQIPCSRVSLQNWVDEQRLEYVKFHSGQPSKLTRSQVARLRAVKFPFNAKGKRLRGVLKPTWEEMYLELLQFRITFNTFQVPWAEGSAAGDLFHWVKDQQMMFAAHQAKMKQSNANNVDIEADTVLRKRIAKLRNVGFPFAKGTEAFASGRSHPVLAQPNSTKRGTKQKSHNALGNVSVRPQPPKATTTPANQQELQQQTLINNKAEQGPELLHYYPSSLPAETVRAPAAVERALPPYNTYFPQQPPQQTLNILLGNSPLKNSSERNGSKSGDKES